MCRFIAYHGEPILLEALVSLPSHSLVRQSTHAQQAPTPANADGFGLGWYGPGQNPETYHSEKPARLDRDLPSICERVRAGHFFAHVRAATGTDVMSANCHPFTSGKWMFMHNGQIGGWPGIRDRVEATLSPELKGSRRGTTDSEAIFLSAIGDGLERDPVSAFGLTISRIETIRKAAGSPIPFRFAAAVSNGESLWAFRWASDGIPPTLYRRRLGGITVASEPTDQGATAWDEVPAGSCTIIDANQRVRSVSFQVSGHGTGITRVRGRSPVAPSSPSRSARLPRDGFPARRKASSGCLDLQPC